MNKPAIPAIPGIVKMTPLEMNSVHFDKTTPSSPPASSPP